MKTSIMFINQSQPLSAVPVRLAGDEANILITDAEGRIEIDLIQGTHVFEIQVGEEWLRREVNRKGDSPMFVVDVSQSSAASMTTLNTLQVNLSEMVGDRYVFETVLGRGGMGVVVKAIDRLLNRPVAIKMLSDELQDNEEAQQIFLVEARNLATLSHPNLVAIHDILNIDGRVLMVFEYVLGENLETTIQKRGKIDQLEVLRIAIQLTRCVSYLHKHELIHRDLKPSNVIMQTDGTLKLIDFGLARSLTELYIRGTRVRGTPAYMAPEQVMGIHLTVATDLYQIGISLYELLAGKLPFPSGDMAYAHVHMAPPSLKARLPELDEEFAKVLSSLLEKQPRDRPASAHELLERLSLIYARLSGPDDILGGFSDVSFVSELHSSVASVSVDDYFDSMESGDNIRIPEMDTPPPSSSSTTTIALAAALVIVAAIIGIVVLQQSGSNPGEVEAATIVSPMRPEPAALEEPEVEPEPKADPVEEIALEVDPEPEPAVEKPIVAKAKAAKPVAKPKVRQAVAKPKVRQPVAKPVQKKATPKPQPEVVEPVKEPEVKAMKPKKKGGFLTVDPEMEGEVKKKPMFLPTK